jgi:hypothetical protein
LIIRAPNALLSGKDASAIFPKSRREIFIPFLSSRLA